MFQMLWISLLPFISLAMDTSDQAAPSIRPDTLTDSPKLVSAIQHMTRTNTWTLTNTTPLNFNTYHPQGLAITPTRIFLTSVDIINATELYPHPRKNGLDRSPGTGVGHLFVLNRHNGSLEKDIRLLDGSNDHKYHPGGIDYDGTYIYVPLAQYRPYSSASIYRVHAERLTVEKLFDADDHYGGIIHNRAAGAAGTLVGNNWGSRNFTEWTMDGRVLRKWTNRGFFIDYQDGQYVSPGRMIAGGIAELPQNPAAQSVLGSTAVYELGGVALIDLQSTDTLWETPLQLWSDVGHVITRNPFKLGIEGDALKMWVAPNDGSEKGGTKILTYVSSIEI